MIESVKSMPELKARWKYWRDELELSWRLRDEGWWASGLFVLAFFGAPVIMGLVFAAVTGDLWWLFVLAWPALWLVMGIAGG